MVSWFSGWSSDGAVDAELEVRREACQGMSSFSAISMIAKSTIPRIDMMIRAAKACRVRTSVGLQDHIAQTFGGADELADRRAGGRAGWRPP